MVSLGASVPLLLSVGSGSVARRGPYSVPLIVFSCTAIGSLQGAISLRLRDGLPAGQEVLVDPDVGLHVRPLQR